MATRVSVISASTAEGTAAWHEAEVQQFARDFITAGVTNTGTNLEVAQQASPNNTVKVKAGTAYIEVTKNGKTFKCRFENDADYNITIAANSSGSTRKDRIVARVDVVTDPNITAGNIGILEVVAGTPSGSPEPPALPSYSISLAIITVAHGDSVIQTADITDDRTIAQIPARFIANIAESQVTGLTSALAGKEPTISKADGFNLALASQAQAEAGTSETTLMNPLRTKQAIRGISLSTMKVLQTTRTMNTASGNVTLAHGLSITPKYIQVIAKCIIKDTSNTFPVMQSDGFSNGTNNYANYSRVETVGSNPSPPVMEAGNSATKCLSLQEFNATSSVSQEATASFNETNVTLSFTKTGTSTASYTMYIMIIVFA